MKELTTRLETNNSGATTERQSLRNAERKLREVQQRVQDQDEQLLSSKLEIKRLEERVQDEKSKSAQLSLGKVDLDAKVRCLEKELRRATQIPNKTPTPPANLQTVPTRDELSEEPSDE